MPQLDRRRFVSYLGAGSALAATGSAQVLLAPPRRPDLDTVSRQLQKCSNEAAFPTALALLEKGATWQDLLGGIFLAGARDINPHPIGGRFHCVMMVESAFQLAEQTTAARRLLPVLYNLDYLKRSQVADRRRGDWVLPEHERGDKPKAGSTTSKGARRAFEKAMVDWDWRAADRAIIDLHATTPMDDVFECLWPFGARDYTAIGHKSVYTAAAYRMLKRIGWKHGLPVLRSLSFGLLYGSGRGQAVAPFAANKKLVARLKEGWDQGKPDPEDSGVVLSKLRRVGVDDAGATVVDLLGRGMAPESIWDGYRLLAAELLMRSPGILAVHPTTALNGLHFAWRTTRMETTRRLLLLQGASWLALFRISLQARNKMTLEKPGIDKLKPADAADQRDFAEEIRRLVFTKGVDTHVYKYGAAMLEDHRLCHPTWAPRILAASQCYLPKADQADAPVYGRVQATLKKLSGHRSRRRRL